MCSKNYFLLTSPAPASPVSGFPVLYAIGRLCGGGPWIRNRPFTNRYFRCQVWYIRFSHNEIKKKRGFSKESAPCCHRLRSGFKEPMRQIALRERLCAHICRRLTCVNLPYVTVGHIGLVEAEAPNLLHEFADCHAAECIRSLQSLVGNSRRCRKQQEARRGNTLPIEAVLDEAHIERHQGLLLSRVPRLLHCLRKDDIAKSVDEYELALPQMRQHFLVENRKEACPKEQQLCHWGRRFMMTCLANFRDFVCESSIGSINAGSPRVAKKNTVFRTQCTPQIIDEGVFAHAMAADDYKELLCTAHENPRF